MDIKKPKEPEANTLTGRQQRALFALAAGDLKKNAAEEAGVCPQAISEWLRQPHFRNALDAIRTQLAATAIEELKSMTSLSLRCLRQAQEEGPPALRLKAAMYTLDRVLLMQHGEPNPEVFATGQELTSETVLTMLGMVSDG
jgi:hypothetical protein